MELAARIGTMARRGAPLPYLRRVAYLESHGTEYIDSGIKPTDSESYIEAEMAFPYVSGQHLSGCDGTLVGINNGLIFLTNIVSEVNRKYKLKMMYKPSGRSMYVDGLPSGTGSNYHYTKNKILAFAWAAETIKKIQKMRIYGIRFFENEFKFDYIPVIDLSGRPAMYDEVSGQLFYNQGTGEFTWGEL